MLFEFKSGHSVHSFYFCHLKPPENMKSDTKCSTFSDTKFCPRCNDNQIIKNGKTKTKKQQYFCKSCQKRFIEFYTYNAYQTDLNQQIIILTKEGLGIRSTARVLKISTTTLLKRIISIANNIKPPMISFGKEYEVDELCTYIGSKEKRIWIVCALEKISKNIIAFVNIRNYP